MRSPVRLREFVVHQLFDGAAYDLVRGMDDDARDHDRDDRVGEPPAHGHRQHQRRDHADIRQDVGGVVQGIGLDRGRAGEPRDPALIGHKRRGDEDGEDHDADPHRRAFDRLRLDDAADRLDDEEDRRRCDEDRLAEPCQRLRLAMAEAVFAVRRLERLAHGEEVDERGEHVHHRVGERREQAHGIRGKPGAELGGDHQGGGGNREIGRPTHQPARTLGLDLGSA